MDIKSKDNMLNVLENIKDSISLIEIDSDGNFVKFISYNDITWERLGYTKDEFEQMDLEKIYPIETFLAFKEKISELRAGKTITLELLNIKKDGGKMLVEVKSNLVISEGKEIMLSVSRDITEKKEFEERIRLFSKVYEKNNEGIAITDLNGRIEYVNKAFCDITGYEEEFIRGKNPKILKSGRHDAEFYKNMWSSIIENDIWEGEIWNKSKAGEIYLENLRIFTIRNASDEPTNYAAVFTDITDKKKKEERINFLAYRDSLTGLYNRAFLMNRLKYELDKRERDEKKLSIMFLDLDGFKRINDNLGHNVGDEIIKMFAERLKNCVRECDTVSRIGGDEFIILLPTIEGIEGAVKVAKRIQDVFKIPFVVKEYELYMGCSIGVATYPNDGKDADTIIKNADIAMYKAKENKENKIELYSPILNEAIREQFEVENNLRNALENGEIYLNYQPIIDIKNNKIAGAEALIRWNSPELGMVRPDIFIPVAEKNNLIINLGEWALRTACIQNKKWQDEGHDPIFIAVNISVRQLEQRGFVSMVGRIIEETGIDPKYLELEITESISMEDIDSMIAILQELSYLGIKVSMDDFGTGYSSLGKLNEIPISKLKIDKSFIDGIDYGNTAIVATIISMAKILELELVAEGVESYEQLNYLKNNDCEFVQGYFYSRPLLADDFEEFMKKEQFIESEI